MQELLFISILNPPKALSMKKKKEANRALLEVVLMASNTKTKIIAGLILNFRRWSGINSRAGKSGVAIVALSLWLKRTEQ